MWIVSCICMGGDIRVVKVAASDATQARLRAKAFIEARYEVPVINVCRTKRA